MNLAQRQQYVLELEARHRANVARIEAQRARYEGCMNLLQQAMTMYVDTITAPLRAFAQELRR